MLVSDNHITGSTEWWPWINHVRHCDFFSSYCQCSCDTGSRDKCSLIARLAVWVLVPCPSVLGQDNKPEVTPYSRKTPWMFLVCMRNVLQSTLLNLTKVKKHYKWTPFIFLYSNIWEAFMFIQLLLLTYQDHLVIKTEQWLLLENKSVSYV